MKNDIEFTLVAKNDITPLKLSITQAVIAGWTGRDPVARDKHIAELAAIGIAPPASTPIYYRCAARRLTTAGSIECTGTESSGEVEFVLFGSEGRTFVGVGSDHTDRKVETYNITVSKQMCDKPVAPMLWDLADIEGHWDQIMLRSWATIDGERVLYQEGALSGMLPVHDLIERGFGTARLPDGCAMFCGTFAAKGGIRPASRFDYVIEDPVLKRSISHGCEIITLPVLG
ncbi:DUF2848 domain-containing protein [Bradyrhizobium neotropicale]|uniref:DUF2848 domain-containing protein n=1 Tax=Bradyrhizobium neotropicale TaxID=1497615 RepID=UPI001AD6A040|nr:DUF2848 domain-containing protein [Bradyrhizobium neotropicale]MBO4221077.1 DUF2848 domain-containing protein [Bradyrhizobium neotropicale]